MSDIKETVRWLRAFATDSHGVTIKSEQQKCMLEAAEAIESLRGALAFIHTSTEEGAMTMLEDVPGETLLERIARLKEWYLEMQFLVGKLKSELEIARAVNRLTLTPADRKSEL